MVDKVFADPRVFAAFERWRTRESRVLRCFLDRQKINTNKEEAVAEMEDAVSEESKPAAPMIALPDFKWAELERELSGTLRVLLGQFLEGADSDITKGIRIVSDFLVTAIKSGNASMRAEAIANLRVLLERRRVKAVKAEWHAVEQIVHSISDFAERAVTLAVQAAIASIA